MTSLRPRFGSNSEGGESNVAPLALTTNAAPVNTAASTASFMRQPHLVVPITTLKALPHLQRWAPPVDELAVLREENRWAMAEIGRLKAENSSLRGVIEQLGDNLDSVAGDVTGVKTHVDVNHSRMNRKLFSVFFVACSFLQKIV